MPDALVSKLSDSLFAWSERALPKGAVADVYGWRNAKGYIRLALGGDPDSLFRLFNGFDEPWSRPGHLVEHDLARSFGIVQQGAGTRNRLPQFIPDGPVYATSLLEGIGGMMDNISGDETGDETAGATIIPDPGRPFNGRDTEYYSARAKRWRTQGTPEWVLPVAVRTTRRGQVAFEHGADYCLTAPRIDARSKCGWLDAGTLALLATHSLGIDRVGVSDTAGAINRCGGLLFPSIALGAVPASNFGPCMLILDPRTAMRGLDPYRKPGVGYPAHVYNTDVWTETTSDFVGDYAAYLYDELSGNGDFLYSPHLYALGPRPTTNRTSGVDGRGGELSSVTEVLRDARSRAKIWRKGLTQKTFATVHQKTLSSMEKYGYLEAKIAGVLEIQALAGAACADFQAPDFQRLLELVGFKGPLLVLDTDAKTRKAFSEQREESAWLMLKFAWSAAEEIKKTLPGCAV